MEQDHSYPEPAQLRAFADEPMPFHTVQAADLEALSSGHLRYGVGPVEYRWKPEYIRCETADGDHIEVSEWDGARLTHDDVWDDAQNVKVSEDYVCASTITSARLPGDAHVEAFWTLSEVRIES